MTRHHTVSIEIYKRHNRLFRNLNDAWIFVQLMRPEMKRRGDELRNSRSKTKKSYPVPKRDKAVQTNRTDEDLGQVFIAQYDRGLFETNIIAIVSRVEAFIQECMVIAISAFNDKLRLIEKGGVPLDLFFAHDDRNVVLERLIALRCQDLMFAKPVDYLGKVAEVLSIKLPNSCIADYVELKATRDVLIHNQGLVNRLYIDKAGAKARGQIGDELTIDEYYFGDAIMSAKALSIAIQRETEKKYK